MAQISTDDTRHTMGGVPDTKDVDINERDVRTDPDFKAAVADLPPHIAEALSKLPIGEPGWTMQDGTEVKQEVLIDSPETEEEEPDIYSGKC